MRSRSSWSRFSSTLRYSWSSIITMAGGGSPTQSNIENQGLRLGSKRRTGSKQFRCKNKESGRKLIDLGKLERLRRAIYGNRQRPIWRRRPQQLGIRLLSGTVTRLAATVYVLYYYTAPLIDNETRPYRCSWLCQQRSSRRGFMVEAISLPRAAS